MSEAVRPVTRNGDCRAPTAETQTSYLRFTWIELEDQATPSSIQVTSALGQSWGRNWGFRRAQRAQAFEQLAQALFYIHPRAPT